MCNLNEGRSTDDSISLRLLVALDAEIYTYTYIVYCVAPKQLSSQEGQGGDNAGNKSRMILHTQGFASGGTIGQYCTGREAFEAADVHWNVSHSVVIGELSM